MAARASVPDGKASMHMSSGWAPLGASLDALRPADGRLVEELMHYDPFDPAMDADPDHHFSARRERCPVHHHAGFDFYTVGGVDIPKDAMTMVLFAAVNRDPDLWDDRTGSAWTGC